MEIWRSEQNSERTKNRSIPRPAENRRTARRRADAILSLQRAAGNRAVARSLRSDSSYRAAVNPSRDPVVQREFVHWQLANNKAITEREGHKILGGLAEGDSKALAKLPPRQGRGDLGTFEFGLGRNDVGQYCIVEGSATGVNWSEGGTTKGVVPVAHSHPSERRQLEDREGGYELGELMQSGQEVKVASARHIVLPSVDDVIVANKVKSEQETHTVYTPYRVKKVKKQSMVTSDPTKGKPLSFTIHDVQSFIVKNGLDRYLYAHLTAWAGSKELLTVETWSGNFGKTDRAVEFSRPAKELEKF
jgi:hypothetical protein